MGCCSSAGLLESVPLRPAKPKADGHPAKKPGLGALQEEEGHRLQHSRSSSKQEVVKTMLGTLPDMIPEEDASCRQLRRLQDTVKPCWLRLAMSAASPRTLPKGGPSLSAAIPSGKQGSSNQACEALSESTSE